LANQPEQRSLWACPPGAAFPGRWRSGHHPLDWRPTWQVSDERPRSTRPSCPRQSEPGAADEAAAKLPALIVAAALVESCKPAGAAAWNPADREGTGQLEGHLSPSVVDRKRPVVIGRRTVTSPPKRGHRHWSTPPPATAWMISNTGRRKYNLGGGGECSARWMPAGTLTAEAGQFAGAERAQSANRRVHRRPSKGRRLLSKGVTPQPATPTTGAQRRNLTIRFSRPEAVVARLEGFAPRPMAASPRWGLRRGRNGSRRWYGAIGGDWCISRQRTWGRCRFPRGSIT